jgi:hypothetical protein
MTKDVPDLVNEAKPIAAATMVIFVLCTLVFPLVFVIGLDPITRQFVVTVSIALAIISTLVILFLPKLFVLYTKTHLSRGLSSRVMKIQSSRDGDNGKLSKDDERREFDAADLDKMPPKDAIEFAQLQISKWTAARVWFQERQFGDASSYSSYQSVAPSVDEEDKQTTAKTSTLVFTQESNNSVCYNIGSVEMA